MTWRIEEDEDRHHHYFRMYLDGKPAVIGSAIVLKELDHNPPRLEAIQIYSPYRRKGYGNTLLKVVLGQYHVLYGKVEAFADKPMSTNQLIKWYRSHGFKVSKDHRIEHGQYHV